MTNPRLQVDPDQLVPQLAHDVTSIPMPDGQVRLRGPRLARPLLLRWLAWLFRLPVVVEVELDDIGSFVIARFDGRTLGRIAEELAAHLQLTRREAEVALADFMRQLMQRRLAELAHMPSARGRSA
jgi:hypothetical protein